MATIISMNLTEYMAAALMPVQDYAEAVTDALTDGRINPPLTTRCPECDSDFADLDEAYEDAEHIIVLTTADTTAVIVGCEGYYVVDPNLVGIDCPNWEPWMTNETGGTLPQGATNDKGYPVCPGAPVDSPHYLCFMERRDLDNCPECDHPIPENLKLNDEMTGPR